jgi:ribose transport system substrate-binding protein
MKRVLALCLSMVVLVFGCAVAVAETGSGVAFNPDTETDTIPYDQLEAKFGPVPKLEGEITIGSILKNNANEFWLMLADGMQKAGSDLGAKIDIQATRTETDTAGQLAIAETMLENQYKALVLSPLTNDNLDASVKAAISSGIPIVNCNCEYIADCDTFVGGLQIEIGRKSADYIAKKIGEKGKVAIIEGVPGTFTSIQRVAGFMENIVKYPNIEIVASQPANYEVEQGMNVAANILTQNPDLAAFYACNDNMALGAIEALRAVNMLGKVIVVGVDGTGDAYKSVEKGELTATVDQFPAINGYAAVDVALRILGGQKLPKVVSTPIEVVDRDNMSQFNK